MDPDNCSVKAGIMLTAYNYIVQIAGPFVMCAGKLASACIRSGRISCWISIVGLRIGRVAKFISREIPETAETN